MDNGWTPSAAFCRLAVNDLIVNPNVAMLGFTMKPLTPTYSPQKTEVLSWTGY
jgi:hypothetical protein